MIKLNDILYEENRYKKETGESLPKWKDLLKRYEASKEYFVHFSNVPRVGLYIVNKYDTPIGFYAYPLDFEKMSNFAVNRPYAIVFQIKQGAKVLDVEDYSARQYNLDISKLENKYKPTEEELEDWANRAKYKSLIGFLWNITRNLSLKTAKLTPNYQKGETGGGTTGKWSSILHKDLGYDCVLDNQGFGVIHTSEPYQAVFFNTTVIEVVDIVSIPKGKVKYKEDFSKESLNFFGQDLRGKDFKDQELNDANFGRANLENVNLSQRDLTNTNFSGANLQNADLKDSNLKNSNLSYTNLKYAILSNAILRSANFKKANLQGADLKKAEINRTDLTGVNLQNANLTGADLWNANLTGADLRGADLRLTDLYEATVNGAKYDNNTKFDLGYTYASDLFKKFGIKVD